ncbi:GlxA family transcriptional regulator [Mycolicibacterium mengxianglii]|uniref:GlxA family transcriptional regulator n=1 Tax=Mycolicibacterium mengxianglii TaxID=2736649 RepID=UPI0018EED20E|nr:GlxA family transcriptional regulator [Mycolicibacterium mengxianglii]
MTTAPPAHPEHLVVVLLYDGIQMLDVTGPVDAFASANTNGAGYRIIHASTTGHDVVASSGARLGADMRAADVPTEIDTLLIPGAPNWQATISDEQLITTTRALALRSRRTVSICAGAFPLAATGLLDGRRAATHWKLARQLAFRFPDVAVDAASLFVTDGPFVTSAGITAGIDLTLSLIEKDHGPALAREVAQDLVVFMARPGDQSQFSVRLEALPTDNAVVRAAMDAVTSHPAGDHSLKKLAAGSGVSPRHLTRLFLTETGHTPQHFVDRTRLEAACAMLTGGHAPVEVVAERAGIGSPESMRRLFQRELGITPSAYRRRFQSTAGQSGVPSAHR